MIILINPSGRTVEVDDNQVNKLLKHGYSIADESERIMYLQEFYTEDYKKFPSIQFVSNVGEPDGYGMSSVALIESFLKNKVVLQTQSKNQKVGLVYTYPTHINKLQTKHKFIYTMFESTSISTSWIESLLEAKEVFVPSKFCQQAFATKGIETTVIPLGYNPKFFFLEKENKFLNHENKPFTFLHYDAFNSRKGWDLVFQAFTKEFGNDPQVKLIFKTVKETLPFPIPRSQYPNIEIIKDRMSHSGLRELIYSSDCFVFPSRGEGFGLTPLEALACGVPGIIPNGSGMSEYFNSDYFLDVKFSEIPAMYYDKMFLPQDVGNMIEVDVNSLRKAMRYAFDNQVEMKERGLAGAKWAEDNYTIQKTANLLIKKLKKYI